MSDHSMNELTYHVAASLDGFIAHEDGSFAGFEWDEQVVADFLADLQRFRTVLMGRKTYAVGLREGKTSPYPSMRQIVFSRTMQSSPDKAVELVQGDIAAFVQALKREQNGPVWLCGGGQIAATLMQAGLIDRLVIKLNPILFGAGIPLFAAGIKPAALKLEETKRYDCGIILLRYRVRQP